MFITIGGIAQYVSSTSAGFALMSNPIAHESTAVEAAECVMRMVANGNAQMKEANEEFIRLYTQKQSA